MRLLGAHMSIAGGVDQAIDRGASIDCTAIQIFVKNNNRWYGKAISEEEAGRFKQKREETGIFVFAHTGYLINLASPKPDIYKKSMESMLDELNRCELLEIPFIVLHPGSFLDSSAEIGTKKIADSLNKLFSRTEDSKVRVALETTAGQGSSIGHTFEELQQIIDLIKAKSRIGVCFDTCHTYAAGYDLKSEAGYKEVWKHFDGIIGLDQLLAFHLNDSKKEFQSRKDRHEQIGKGFLGLESFRNLMNDKRFNKIPMVLETYKGPDLKEDIENLKILRDLA
ncbi:deoxyribonuclease IV [Candidatus Margulisiibacteriota bacterium]